MQEKLKQLELLATQLLTRQKELAGENERLKQRVRVLEESALKLKEVEQKLKDVSDWKKNTQTVLRRLASRVDKELEKAKQDDHLM